MARGGRGNVRVSINSEFDARGVRQAERSLSGLNHTGGRTSSMLGGLGSAAGVAAAAGVGLLAVEAKRAFDAFDEARKVTRQTEAVLKSTGGQAGVTADQVARLADSLSKKTGVDDEAIQRGENLLLTFRNVHNEAGRGNDIFNRATQAALDLSKAGFGSLDTTSKQLGKALNDPIRGMTALGRAGVTFTQQQRDQITALVESNRSLDAQKVILREVEKQVGGSAEATATNTDKMKVAFENLEEGLGRGLAPIVDSVAGKLTNFARDAEGPLNRVSKRLTNIFDRDDIDLGDKLKLSAGVVRRQIINPLKRAFERSGLGDDLKDAIDRGLPLVMNGMTKAGGKAAGLFVKAWWNSDVWTRLLTAGFIIGKLGGFRTAGRWAAGALGASFAGSMAKDATFATAGRGAGTKFGKGLAAGVILALPLMMPEIIKQFDELFSKIKIKTKFGIPTGIEFDAPFDIEKWSDQNLNPNRQPIGGQPTGFDMPGLTKTPRIRGQSVRDGGGGSVLKNSGSIIGTPGTGTHTLGNWQSDNAVDIRIVRGTPVLAVEGGKVTKVSIRPEGGRISGSSITIHGHSGNDYFYTHLSAVSVKTGQRVQGGQVIGKSGVANGVPHLHFATREGDPRNARLENGQRVVTSLTKEQRIVAQAAQKYGIDPAILWGLYGTESNFGKNLGPSSAGALGPFQFMPGTAKEYGIDPMNFEEAAFAAAKFLSRYKGRGTLGMLSAYNAGPGGALQPGYRDSVLKLARQFPTVDLQGGDTIETTPTDPRKIAQTQAEALMLPIARRLRRQLVGPIGMIGGSLRRLDRADKSYTLMERGAGLVDEDLDTQEGRDARVLELTGLIGGKTNIGFQQQTHLNGIKRAIGRYKAAIASLRAQLKKAPTGQKGFIRGRIRKYRARIKDLRDEARELGFDIAETDLDVQELFAERDEAGTLLDTEMLQPGDSVEDPAAAFIDRDIAAAVFSGDKNAERAAWQRKRNWLAGQLPAALLTPDPRDETALFDALTSVDATLKSIDENTENTTRLMQQNLDLERELKEEAQKRAAAAETYASQFPKWLADVVSGEVGGRVGLGMQSGGTPGVLAGNL